MNVKRILLAVGFGVAIKRGVTKVMRRNVDLVEFDLGLQLLELADLRAKWEKVPAETRRRIERADQEPYQIPDDAEPVTLNTVIGEVRLTPARGYFRGTGIFVYLEKDDEGKKPRFDQNLAQAFLKATKGEFHFDKMPGSSSGGTDRGYALITAGLDYNAYQREESGYFKCSPAPELSRAAAILARCINDLYAGNTLHA